MKNSSQELAKEQYRFLYKISRSNFVFGNCSKSQLELLAEFDNVSGDFEKFSGWIETGSDSGLSYETIAYGEIVLEPLVKNCLIYHFKGTLEWVSVSDNNHDLKDRLMPLSVRPVYDSKSGRIITLVPSAFEDSKIIFKEKVEIIYLDQLGDFKNDA